jgi:hypothetical protein
MRTWHLVYWLITGALLGLGLVELPGLGLILFPVGLVLLIIGLVALRGRELIAGIVGFGALPEAAFVNALVIVNNLHEAAPLTYYGATLICGVITVVGLVALGVVWRTNRRAADPSET